MTFTKRALWAKVGSVLLIAAFAIGTDKGPALAQGMSTLCKFTNGAKSGTTFDYAQMGFQPLPVGTPCQDGAGSTGKVVSK